MATSDLAEVVGVLHRLWHLDDLGLFDTEPGWRALLAMETCLLDWIATAPDSVLHPESEPSARERVELPGQDVLPFGGEG